VSEKIVIAVNESGAHAATTAIERLATAAQKLSPALAKSLRGRALRLGVNLERMVKDASIAVLDTVVHRTPHDTGLARANWNTSVRTSRPDVSVTTETDYDGDETVAKGRAIIESAKLNPGQVIFISNAVAHIVPLNEGWSQQAPAGFVEQAVQAGVETVKRRKGTMFDG